MTASIAQRIPPGVRRLVEAGHDDALIRLVGGYRFTLQGLPAGKGPYAWVGRDTAAGAPAMHWEYLVQAAEYARIYRAVTSRGYTIAVEDRLMDITVSDTSGQLRWYLEVKEKAADVPRFVADIRGYGASGVDVDAPDRGNDALRKAKYIVCYRPEYFSVSAIGMRMDFAVTQDGNRFSLVEDMVPSEPVRALRPAHLTAALVRPSRAATERWRPAGLDRPASCDFWRGSGSAGRNSRGCTQRPGRRDH